MGWASTFSETFESLQIPYFQPSWGKYLFVNGGRYRELKDAVLFPTGTSMGNIEATREGREKEQRCNLIAGLYSFVLTLVIAVKLLTSF